MADVAALSSVKDVKLSVKQEALLHALERKVQLRAQAESNALIMQQTLHNERARGDNDVFAAASMKEFLSRHIADSLRRSLESKSETTMEGGGADFVAAGDATLASFAVQVDACAAEWGEMYSHAHQSFALVEEMEVSHAQVASKTQALYDSFENILQQVEALNTRVDVIAAPMPHFTAIDKVAQTLGFGVKFASASSNANTAMTTGGVVHAQPQAQQQRQQPVQVFQHKRNIDPTTKAFEEALEKIDACVAYLEQHVRSSSILKFSFVVGLTFYVLCQLEYRDSVCYIEAYRTLTAGGIQCLKEYAVNGLDTAKDAVYEALAKANASSSLPASSSIEVGEASAHYVNFQLVAPALTAVAKQLERLATSSAAMSNPTATSANVLALSEVCSAYVNQRVQLLSSALSLSFEATSQSTDIVNLLRVSCAYLVKVCDAEFRLFLKLFGKEPRDALFVFHNALSDDDQDEDEGQETPFERMIFQLSGLLYSVVRPQMIQQKDLEVLCEIIQVLKSEVIESIVQPRAAVVGFVEPVMHRMIQDAQERLILCMQKYIRDEIEGFTPEAADLDYPNKLMNPSASMYATWYPALEHTLLCLSKVYHFVNMEIFEELAQDAIQICTVSLKMASADLTVAKGALHGTLFLVKHLLTLREQITPFDIKFSLTNKALDFTSSADAMSHLLSEISTIFSFSMQDNALVGLFTNAIPQIQEKTSDVKKELEQELKKSCTSFIDAVLQQIAQPLLTMMKQIAALQARAVKSNALLDFRQCKFASPDEINKTLQNVSAKLQTDLPEILNTIHLYLRNSSTETILFKPVQRNLLDAVESLKALLDQTYTAAEQEPCENAFQLVIQQLRAL
uniref:Conserved oligomeric Golgi complex subunit 3 C-terminal domain-containing protein n=1 Tax=Globisporangium ultimum (strain ATCC 200006 / CBS 805.95 / DAOM BR144) TaxID=431595 RepID=K3WNE7_GLOUD